MFQNLEYKKYKKKEIIFEQGDFQNGKLYVILSGSILVLINKDLDLGQGVGNGESDFAGEQIQFKEEKRLNMQRELEILQRMPAVKIKISLILLLKFKIQLRKLRQKIHKRVQKQLFLQENFITFEEKFDLMNKYGKTTRIMTQGQIFGEKALYSQQEVRTATVIVDRSNTELLLLDKFKWQRVLEKLKEEIESRKIIFSKIFSDFQLFSSFSIDNFVYSFTPELFQKDAVILKENSACDNLFIIQKGEILIQKDDCEISLEVDGEHLIEKRSIDLSIIGECNLFGEECLFSNQLSFFSYRVNSIRCLILRISRRDLERRFPVEMRQFLKQIFQDKKILRQALLEKRISEFQQQSFLQRKSEQSATNDLVIEGSRQKMSLKEQKSKKGYLNDLQPPINSSSSLQHLNLNIQQKNSKKSISSQRISLTESIPQQTQSYQNSKQSPMNSELEKIQNFVYDFGDVSQNYKFQRNLVKHQKDFPEFIQNLMATENQSHNAFLHPKSAVQKSQKVDKKIKIYMKSMTLLGMMEPETKKLVQIGTRYPPLFTGKTQRQIQSSKSMRSKISMTSNNKNFSYPENLYLEQNEIQVVEGGALLYLENKKSISSPDQKPIIINNYSIQQSFDPKSKQKYFNYTCTNKNLKNSVLEHSDNQNINHKLTNKINYSFQTYINPARKFFPSK